MVSRPTIRLGMPDTQANRDATKALQERLCFRHQYAVGRIDSVFDERMDSIVRQFQSDKLLTADGIVGPKTWASIDSVDCVYRMFPHTPRANIDRNLPHVMAGLKKYGLTDKQMVCMALATIRAETESFEPINEGQSKYNTRSQPFDLYDDAERLGNTGRPDGPNFRGRGYVQITGRWNYTHYGYIVGVDLVAEPEEANDPATAGLILGAYLKDHEDRIRLALASGDMKAARRAVNGGTHGLDRFVDAYNIGMRCLP